ncbi:MAG: lysophospholipase [Sphaerochaetaceae bacterium]|nr:lysophospholipase [Sphaerochaetaceae bacterium]
MEKRNFTCSDSRVIAYRVWLPKKGNRIIAVVHILHGMAEHSARYDEFAKFLASNSIAVFAQDHRGHGDSILNGEKGFFADSNGWQRVADDAFELSSSIAAEFPGIPLFLMGHSMGSFLARTVMVQHPELYDGVIIMGTGASQGIVGSIGRLIAKGEVKKNGPHQPSEKMNKLSFGNYNKKFEPGATGFEWLSRDPEAVRKYVEDPLCGFVCTGEFYIDIIDGIKFANSGDNAQKLPKDLPLLIISGSMDPVGNFSKGVKKVYALYHDAGITDVTLKLVDGAHHELLNETDRKDTYKYLLGWISDHIQQ